MPLLWRCGSRIAESVDLGDTDHMCKFFKLTFAFSVLLAAVVVFATPEAQERRQLLDDQIVRYMSQELDLTPSEIAVVALDRRLIVPDCLPGFRIGLPYPDHQTILVECDDPKWSAYVRANVSMVSEYLAYAKSLPAGTQLSATDIRIDTKKTRQVVAREPVDSFVGRLLVRPVRQGQAVMPQHVDTPITVYVLKVAIAQGDQVKLENLNTELKGGASVPIDQRVDRRILQDAVAARNLGQGQRLVANDLQRRWSRLVVTQPIPYGQALSAENVEVRSLYGDEEQQALTSIADITQTQSTRALRVGHIILSTDIRPAPLIRKHDNVNMIVKSGALTITVGLIAEEDGMLHELIKLRNPDSGEKLQGTVTGPGQVNLQY